MGRKVIFLLFIIIVYPRKYISKNKEELQGDDSTAHGYPNQLIAPPQA
jgi:hypothetical protein